MMNYNVIMQKVCLRWTFFILIYFKYFPKGYNIIYSDGNKVAVITFTGGKS